MTHWQYGPLFAAVAFVAASSCANRPELEPAPGAQTVTDDLVVRQVDGVEITAEADAWTGREEVKSEVTVMKMTLENESDRPVKIAYENFALVSDTGRRFSAIPPIRVEGDVTEPVLAEGYTPIATPGFTYDGFYPASYYGPLYPSLSVYTGSFYYDPYYYDTYYTYWNDIELPTQEMLQVALPEGVVDPGGSVSGFLYFEKVDAELPRVSLTADLVNAETGETFAELRIPMLVEETGLGED